MNRRLIATFLLATIALVAAPSCEDDSHKTPEDTIVLLRKAVEQGRADKITRYVYAENENMRKLLNRFGRLLLNLQKLGVEVQKKFPKEVEALRVKAENAAKDPKSGTLISELMNQQRRGGRGNVQIQIGGNAPKRQEDKLKTAFQDTMKQLFADPYAFIQQSEKRLSTEFLTDDSVAVLWDEKPVMAPLGMVMKRDQRDGQWYFVLPTNVPGLSRIMPKTEREFQIWGGIITVFDKMVIDLTKEVEQGRVKSLDDLSHKAGEMALPPLMITFYAYSQLDRAQRKDAKAAQTTPAAPVAPAAPKPEGK